MLSNLDSLCRIKMGVITFWIVPLEITFNEIIYFGKLGSFKNFKIPSFNKK